LSEFFLGGGVSRPFAEPLPAPATGRGRVRLIVSAALTKSLGRFLPASQYSPFPTRTCFPQPIALTDWIVNDFVASIRTMPFSIRLTESAIEDLDYFRKNEREIIAEGIALFLTHDANVETRRRKPLRPNRMAPWELRIDDYRVFYELEGENEVKVIAVGHKVHNDLYIRGKKVKL
jgi:mRNA-degrading endonuclease RelE of RelBE toxin-antitoxin system